VTEQVQIDRLGHRGDGIADTASGPIIVPGALPGEIVTIEREGEQARLLSVDTPSPRRVAPPCGLFGTCGGCAIQHLAAADYAEWKRGIAVTALAQAGIEAEVAPLLPAQGEGRRRVVFHARRNGPEVAIGFMAARSHRLVEIEACPLLAPGLAGAASAAKALARALNTSKPLDIQATATTAGLDIDIRGHGEVGAGKRATLVALAGELDLARLSIHGVILVERRPPLVDMGGIAVQPPPGGFLQATQAGEEALAGLVVDALGKSRKAADLFAGIGPFALRIAGFASVHAVESSAAALAALDRSARFASGLRTVTTEARDLFRRPLLAQELDRFDAVVFDPPRTGAEAQVRQIAATSTLARAVAVSCNPASFARDARILVDAGWRLGRVTPVDQFLYSSHVELVGLFDRPRAARPRRLLG
jgi:23S rRNA (uracil1939-C5)-methyltransferase